MHALSGFYTGSGLPARPVVAGEKANKGVSILERFVDAILLSVPLVKHLQNAFAWEERHCYQCAPMSRRASSKVSLLKIVAALLLLALALGGGFAIIGNLNDPYRTLHALDVAAYYENGNSLRGNVYKVDAKVLNLLAWSPGRGRLFSVEVETKTGPSPLGVLVPMEFNQVNLQKGQNFALKIEVGQDGILTVKDLQKK